MKKFVLGVVALVLFGSFAATSGVFAATHDLPEFVQTADSQTVEPLGISAERRERRVQVCERAWDACEGWCYSSKQGPECREKCVRELADCMKATPYEGD